MGWKKTEIPKNEQENVLDVLWILLRSVEGKVDPKKNILDKHEVTQAYNLLNRIGVTELRPSWESWEKGERKYSEEIAQLKEWLLSELVEDWMSDDDKEAVRQRIEVDMDEEVLAGKIEIGVRNGQSVERQMEIIKTSMKKLSVDPKNWRGLDGKIRSPR